jgi:hypothetical protein
MFTEKVGLGINVEKSAETSHGDLAPLLYDEICEIKVSLV